MIRKHISTLLFLVTAVFPTAFASPDKKMTLLRTSKIFDSVSGAYLLDRDILISGNRIVDVRKKISAPEGTSILDLRKYTLLPGLIDTHTHLMLLDESFGQADSSEMLRNVKKGTALRVQEARPRAKDYLANGITTVRELGNSGEFGDVILKSEIDSGKIIGPRIITSGPGLSPVNGQLPEGTDPKIVALEYRVINGIQDARTAVQENEARGAEVIKVYSDNAPNKQSLSLEELTAIVEEAHSRKMKVAAHAVADTSIKNAVLAGVDSIEHGYTISDENLKLMAEKGIMLVPTDPGKEVIAAIIEKLRPSHPENPVKVEEIFNRGAQRTLRAVKTGVSIAAGSDMYIDLSSLHISSGQGARQVIVTYAEHGLPTSLALQAATLNAAKLLNKEGDLGVIKPGAFADIIAVEGDPLTRIRDLEKIVFVMKDGEVQNF